MAKKLKAKARGGNAGGAGPSSFSRSVIFARRPGASGSTPRGYLVLDCGHSIEWNGAAPVAPSQVACPTCKLAAKPTAARTRRKR
jgi:hypothetical protein